MTVTTVSADPEGLWPELMHTAAALYGLRSSTEPLAIAAARHVVCSVALWDCGRCPSHSILR